jgi:hypothetical protein
MDYGKLDVIVEKKEAWMCVPIGSLTAKTVEDAKNFIANLNFKEIGEQEDVIRNFSVEVTGNGLTINLYTEVNFGKFIPDTIWDMSFLSILGEEAANQVVKELVLESVRSIFPAALKQIRQTFMEQFTGGEE